MTRNNSVMRILRRSSGMAKIVNSFRIASPRMINDQWPRASAHWSLVIFVRVLPSSVSRLILLRSRFHLIPDRLLGRRDQLTLPAFGLDLLAGRLGEVVGLDDQFLGDVALSENTDAVERLFRQPFISKRGDIHFLAGRVQGINVANIYHVELAGEHAVRKPALGESAKERRLPADGGDPR